MKVQTDINLTYTASNIFGKPIMTVKAKDVELFYDAWKYEDKQYYYLFVFWITCIHGKLEKHDVTVFCEDIISLSIKQHEYVNPLTMV